MNVDTAQFQALRGDVDRLGRQLGALETWHDRIADAALQRSDYVLSEVVNGLRGMESRLGLDSPPVLRVVDGGRRRSGRHAAPRGRLSLVRDVAQDGG